MSNRKEDKNNIKNNINQESCFQAIRSYDSSLKITGLSRNFIFLPITNSLSETISSWKTLKPTLHKTRTDF